MRINSKTNQDSAKEPRWLALIAVLAAGLVYAALPNSLSVGPHWLLLAVIAPVSVSALISHRVGHHTADKMMGYAASGILTIAMTWSLGLLVAAIPEHTIDPESLLLLPKGFVRIRHFGFLANRRRAALLPRCFAALHATQPKNQSETSTAPTAHPLWRCPKCGGPMAVVERFTAAQLQLRSPPLLTTAA